MSLCLLGGGAITRIAVTAFTLGWTHTVQKTRWEEVWSIDGNRLVMLEARIQGSGAGMDPPPEARLKGGWYRWKPAVTPQQSFKLARSWEAGDWELCFGRAGCSPLGDWLPNHSEEVVVKACP